MPTAPSKHGATPTLRDVAAAADVSATIASRVLNADPAVRVRDDTRARIHEVAALLGYVPNSLARSLRKSRSDAIGLVMHNLESPLNTRVLAGVRGRCADAGYVTLLADSDQLAVDRGRLRTFLARGRLDGVILHVGHGHHDSLINEISQHLPAVLVNADLAADVPAARLDDRTAGRVATGHLLALGHSDICFIGGPEASLTSLVRQHGYEAALGEAARGLSVDVVNAGWNADDGEVAALQLLSRPRLPTAVVVANVVTASGVLTALRGAGFRVPHDISVVAIHDAWFAKHLAVSLTTVQLPLFELGERAADLLLGILAGEVQPRGVLITDPPPELIPRESTAPPRSRR